MSGAYAMQGETKHAESTEAHSSSSSSSKEAKRSWWSNLPFLQEESVVEAAEAEAKRKAPFLFCVKLQLEWLHVEQPALQPPGLLATGKAMCGGSRGRGKTWIPPLSSFSCCSCIQGLKRC